MKAFFEPENLNNASPATVSRAGIIYVSDSELGWQPIVASWLQASALSYACLQSISLVSLVSLSVLVSSISCSSSVQIEGVHTAVRHQHTVNTCAVCSSVVTRQGTEACKGGSCCSCCMKLPSRPPPRLPLLSPRQPQEDAGLSCMHLSVSPNLELSEL